MPDPLPADDGKKPSGPPDPGADPAAGMAVKMSLGEIIETTGETEHLYELVSLVIDRAGGYTTDEAYFATVHPILDLLEIEILIRCKSRMSRDGLKRVIRNWIDSGIREIRKKDRLLS